MYFLFSLTICCAVIFVCAAPIAAKKRPLLRTAFVLSLVLLAAGIACMIAASVKADVIFSDSALDETYRAWASDTYGLWARTSGIFSAVIGGILVLAALVRHPMVKMRAAIASAVTILLPIGGGIYAVFAENSVTDLVTPIHLLSLACACLIPLGAYLDTAYALFFSSRKKNKKKKKK